MNFLLKGSISSEKLEDVDYSYVEVPIGLVAYRQEIKDLGTLIPITVHQIQFTEKPIENIQYGFCGMIKPSLEKHFGDVCLGGDIKIYTGLEFIRTEGDYFIFQLPIKHPGHEYFKGCSGAPIQSEKGDIVALVCGGNTAKNEIRAISLNTYKTVIDLLVGNI